MSYSSFCHHILFPWKEQRDFYEGPTQRFSRFTIFNLQSRMQYPRSRHLGQWRQGPVSGEG